MDRKFFGFGGDITTRGDDDERVCFAVRVLEIEPAEEHRRGGCYALTEGHSLAYPRDHWAYVSFGVPREAGTAVRFPVKMLKRSKNNGSFT
jgi:hypothetical protein